MVHLKLGSLFTCPVFLFLHLLPVLVGLVAVFAATQAHKHELLIIWLILFLLLTCSLVDATTDVAIFKCNNKTLHSHRHKQHSCKINAKLIIITTTTTIRILIITTGNYRWLTRDSWVLVLCTQYLGFITTRTSGCVLKWRRSVSQQLSAWDSLRSFFNQLYHLSLL